VGFQRFDTTFIDIQSSNSELGSPNHKIPKQA